MSPSSLSAPQDGPRSLAASKIPIRRPQDEQLEPDCALCYTNNQLHYIGATQDAYMVRAGDKEGTTLIIPRHHITAPHNQPRTWWSDIVNAMGSRTYTLIMGNAPSGHIFFVVLWEPDTVLTGIIRLTVQSALDAFAHACETGKLG